MKKVMAFGSFDVLHPGHISHLGQAKRLGDRLIVIVARDSSILMFKKRRPVFNERERLGMVRSLKAVDEAHLGNRIASRDGVFEILLKFRPDVIAIGYDQQALHGNLKERIRRMGLKSKVVVTKPYSAKRYKSSRIRKRIENL